MNESPLLTFPKNDAVLEMCFSKIQFGLAAWLSFETSINLIVPIKEKQGK